MSKPKNRVFCLDCNRQKLVFESKKKAELYIKYNSEEINEESGYKPIRAYYCDACCGWHVTSKEKLNYNKKLHKTNTQRIIEAMNNDISNQKYDVVQFMKKFIYIGLFLSEETRNNILDMIAPKVLSDAKVYLDHCTLLFHTQQNESKANDIIHYFFNNRGKNYPITVTHIGYSDKAIAFKVNIGNIPCMNENPHITICTFKGGKPVDSNLITDWKEIPSFEIKARLDYA